MRMRVRVRVGLRRSLGGNRQHTDDRECVCEHAAAIPARRQSISYHGVLRLGSDAHRPEGSTAVSGQATGASFRSLSIEWTSRLDGGPIRLVWVPRPGSAPPGHRTEPGPRTPDPWTEYLSA